jgi:hypothetical protein
MGKNVTIPMPLLKKLVDLLEFWDISLFDRGIQDDYWDALWALKMKLLKIELRDAYAMIIKAPNEDSKHNARIQYLRLKNQLRDEEEAYNSPCFAAD